jgi:Right handed beta helix region
MAERSHNPDMKKIIALLLFVSTVAFGQSYPSPTYNNLTLIHPLPVTSGGTGSNTGTGALTNIGADPIPVTNNVQYVSTAGNNANSGASPGLARVSIQTAVNALSATGGIVYVAGTYSLTSTLAMQPNVRLICVDGATITQPNGQNLALLIDFSANTANGASIQNCIIDGNRANNTDNANNILVYIATASNVTLTGNTIRNGNGSLVDVSTGLLPVITYNKFSNTYVGPIYFVTGVSQEPTYGQVIGNTISGNIGQHAITLNNSDYNVVSGNTINAALQTGMTVNTAGTTVTSTAGPNFSTLSPGSFIILNGGAEFLITSITDNTHLVVNTTPGTLTGVPAAAGPGDLISLLAASHNTIANNSTVGGVGGGIVVSNFVAGESTQKNQIIGNSIYKVGEGCIELESENTFGTQVFDNQIRGNNLADCGAGGTAVASNTQYGIALIDFNPNTLLNTFIDGNYVRDDQGSPTTQNWMGITSVAVGQVFVGKNTNVSTVNVGVAGGISSVSLGAGWGSTATSSAVTSYGGAFQLTITSNGTGQATGATVTVNTRATTSDNPPVMNCKFTGGTGTTNTVFGELPGTDSSPSLQVFQFAGVPVAGNTYIFLCRG